MHSSLREDVSIAIGFHPNEEPERRITENQIIKLIESTEIKGIGETGLDYYRNVGDLTWQRERFIAHINAAKECKKPLIIHSRDAADHIIKILEQEKAGEVGGVIHCFTEDLDTAKKCIDLGFYISFSGIITFPKAIELQKVVKNIPLDKILIETDAPYLAPSPVRGKINQPAYVKYVAEGIAKLKDLDLEEVAKVTTSNYYRLF